MLTASDRFGRAARAPKYRALDADDLNRLPQLRKLPSDLLLRRLVASLLAFRTNPYGASLAAAGSSCGSCGDGRRERERPSQGRSARLQLCVQGRLRPAVRDERPSRALRRRAVRRCSSSGGSWDLKLLQAGRLDVRDGLPVEPFHEAPLTHDASDSD